jgi:hypothetical protein
MTLTLGTLSTSEIFSVANSFVAWVQPVLIVVASVGVGGLVVSAVGNAIRSVAR